MRVRSDLLVIVKEKEIKEMSIKLVCRDDTLCLNLMTPENNICKVYANVTHQEGKF